MRIGEVVKKYGITKDTIHYYISYGLLVPPKKGTQYDFDNTAIKDLENILELKELSFSLSEIHKILSLTRISGMKNRSDIEELIKLYSSKKDECELELDIYKSRIKSLTSKIVDLRFKNEEHTQQNGLPLSMLEYICCPLCGKGLSVTNATINNQSIDNGILKCECGYMAKIESGILITPNAPKSLYDKPDADRELYKDLPPNMITLFQKSYNKMLDYLNKYPNDNQVIMETYINAYFFMHNHIEYLNPNCKYIVIDKYRETIEMYKNLMAESGCNLDILFIADDSNNYPLKKNLVDINIDFFAANEHQFYKHSFLLEKILPYMKDESMFIGTYFYFGKGNRSMKNLLSTYPESHNMNFSREYFLKSIKDNNIKLIDWQEMGKTTDSGNNLGFGFHEKGEDLHLMTYLCKKIST